VRAFFVIRAGEKNPFLKIEMEKEGKKVLDYQGYEKAQER
jgi:hypothetical protein